MTPTILGSGARAFAPCTRPTMPLDLAPGERVHVLLDHGDVLDTTTRSSAQESGDDWVVFVVGLRGAYALGRVWRADDPASPGLSVDPNRRTIPPAPLVGIEPDRDDTARVALPLLLVLLVLWMPHVVALVWGAP